MPLPDRRRAAWNVVAPLIAPLIAFVAICVLLCGGWVVSSYCEARSYERITGKHVSTWDAMWVDLRVQEQAK